jgi:hypothetical protein
VISLGGRIAPGAHGSFSTLSYGSGRIDPIQSHEQIREFCQFLAHEWAGNRHHSYTVPSRGKSSAWSRTVDGKWSAVGLADAVSKYAWSGKSFSKNKAEFDRFAADLQSAIQRDSNDEVCAILRAIMHWGGVDNKYRQKRTFEWIERNADEISAKLSKAVYLIKDEQASLDLFDGVNLIMNSTMTKIVSLADPEQKLVIYDGRVGGALGFFVARFAEEREIHQYDVADQLLFAVDREAKRTPETKRIHFPALFGKARDRCHASMVRWGIATGRSRKSVKRVREKSKLPCLCGDITLQKNQKTAWIGAEAKINMRRDAFIRMKTGVNAAFASSSVGTWP